MSNREVALAAWLDLRRMARFALASLLFELAMRALPNDARNSGLGRAICDTLNEECEAHSQRKALRDKVVG